MPTDHPRIPTGENMLAIDWTSYRCLHAWAGLTCTWSPTSADNETAQREVEHHLRKAHGIHMTAPASPPLAREGETNQPAPEAGTLPAIVRLSISNSAVRFNLNGQTETLAFSTKADAEKFWGVLRCLQDASASEAAKAQRLEQEREAERRVAREWETARLPPDVQELLGEDIPNREAFYGLKRLLRREVARANKAEAALTAASLQQERLEAVFTEMVEWATLEPVYRHWSKDDGVAYTPHRKAVYEFKRRLDAALQSSQEPTP